MHNVWNIQGFVKDMTYLIFSALWIGKMDNVCINNLWLKACAYQRVALLVK